MTPPGGSPRTRVPRLWLLQLRPDPVHGSPSRGPPPDGVNSDDPRFLPAGRLHCFRSRTIPGKGPVGALISAGRDAAVVGAGLPRAVVDDSPCWRKSGHPPRPAMWECFAFFADARFPHGPRSTRARSLRLHRVRGPRGAASAAVRAASGRAGDPMARVLGRELRRPVRSHHAGRAPGVDRVASRSPRPHLPGPRRRPTSKGPADVIR